MKPDLSTKLCGVKLSNPTILAAGFLGIGSDLLARVAEMGAGAVTVKNAGVHERIGHPNPTVLCGEHYIINAVGLPGPGVDEEVKEIEKYRRKTKTPLIVSIIGGTAKEYSQAAEILSGAKPDFIEVNISCPNVESEFGMPFACDASAAAQVTSAVKNSCRCPIILKLSPNVSSGDFKRIAKSCESAGADALNCGNTLAGIAIDARAKKPVLANKFGGVSGPALKPVALRCVYDAYDSVQIPIVGTGGVTTGEDAAEMILAGASAVGIGSAIYYRGNGVFKLVCGELQDYMKQEGFSKISDFRGLAHK